jgi:glutathione S-transferase
VALVADVRISTEILDDESSQAFTLLQGCPPPRNLYLCLDGDFKVVMTSSMIRLIASMAPSAELLGRTPLETAQIDSWLSFLWHSIELPCTIIKDMRTLNDCKERDCVDNSALMSQLKSSLGIMETHLMKQRDEQHTYFVGELVSLADICFAVALKYYKDELAPVFDRESYLDRWLTTIECTCQLERIP